MLSVTDNGKGRERGRERRKQEMSGLEEKFSKIESSAREGS